jgi:hypothetical protein
MRHFIAAALFALSNVNGVKVTEKINQDAPAPEVRQFWETLVSEIYFA